MKATGSPLTLVQVNIIYTICLHYVVTNNSDIHLYINVCSQGCPDSETNTFQVIIVSGYTETADKPYLEG
jgi:hypothetical protein